MISISALDCFVLLNVFGSFFLFLLVHGLAFRFVAPANILKWLQCLFLTIAAVNVALGLSPFFTDVLPASKYRGSSIFLAASAACVIYSLMVFIYVAAIYAMYESSIRIRILREISMRTPAVMSLSEILNKYNARLILQKRLARLVSAGDLRQNGEVYSPGHPLSVFLIYIEMVKILRAIFGKPEVCN